MKRSKSMEDFLAEAQAPRIVESEHRDRLKHQLMQEYRKEEPIMFRWMSLHQKAAWILGLLLVTVVVTSSWAGYAVLRAHVFEVRTTQDINVIDEQTGEVTSTVQVETVTTIATKIPDCTAPLSDEVETEAPSQPVSPMK